MKHWSTIAAALTLAVMVAAGRPCMATTYTNTVARTTAYITNQMAAGNLAGVSIILVDDQSVAWSAGFGLADRERGIAADADTVYHIASVSKSFAATAIMQLMDDGRIDLEAPLTNYMAEFSMLPRPFTNLAPVTIRSLLNHHSGIPGDFFNGMWTTPLRDDYVARIIRCLQGDYPFAPVNERYYYCNTGWVLLSDVVRRIDGRSFAAAMDARIFAPLGMAASSFIPDKPAISNRLAACYDNTGNRQLMEYVNCLGSGSMYSSANDMAKFIRMILADGRYEGQTILSTNALAVMTTPQLTNLPLNVEDSPQGLGWDNVDETRFRYAGRVIWKNGALLFHCSFLGISPDLKLGVAVIQNGPGSQCDSMGMTALRWAIQDKYPDKVWPTNVYVPPAAPVTNRPQAELNALAGLYVGASGYERVVTGEVAGTLTFIGDAHTDSPGIVSNLVPRANGWFSKADSQDSQMAFTNLDEHAMLVLHTAEGPRESVRPLGEHYVPGFLPPAWSARTNRLYRLVDMDPFDYLWDQPSAKSLHLGVKDGALLAVWMFGTFVMEPQNATLAFQRGVHYRKGGAIQATATNGFELLKYSSYRFLDEAAIPTLPVSTTTNGSIPFANGTQWYWFSGEAGTTYCARLTAPGQEFRMRLTDRAGIVISTGTNGPATLTCASNGTYAIAISASNSFAFSLSLAVCGSRQAQNDYDGDGRSDLAVYRDGNWYIYSVARGTVLSIVGGWGGPLWTPVPGDYDGDGRSDLAVYRDGAWYIRSMASGNVINIVGNWGGPLWKPVPGDYDGDGKADLAVYQNGNWYIYSVASGNVINIVGNWGGPGWIPVPGDYDGDGKADLAVYRDGNWYIYSAASGSVISIVGDWGGIGWIPVPGDYDGDGNSDLAVYRDGNWYIYSVARGVVLNIVGNWGGPDWTPVPGDYDGDGKADLAVYRDGAWYIYSAAKGTVLNIVGNWGGPDWQPVQ